jgi:hypothetical protein
MRSGGPFVVSLRRTLPPSMLEEGGWACRVWAGVAERGGDAARGLEEWWAKKVAAGSGGE